MTSPSEQRTALASWSETLRVRLQLTLLVVQVLAIVFGGMAMFLEVRGVTRDVRDLKNDVRELREADAARLVIHRDIEDLRGRVQRVEDRERR